MVRLGEEYDRPAPVPAEESSGTTAYAPGSGARYKPSRIRRAENPVPRAGSSRGQTSGTVADRTLRLAASRSSSAPSIPGGFVALVRRVADESLTGRPGRQDGYLFDVSASPCDATRAAIPAPSRASAHPTDLTQLPGSPRRWRKGLRTGVSAVQRPFSTLGGR